MQLSHRNQALGAPSVGRSRAKGAAVSTAWSPIFWHAALVCDGDDAQARKFRSVKNCGGKATQGKSAYALRDDETKFGIICQQRQLLGYFYFEVSGEGRACLYCVPHRKI